MPRVRRWFGIAEAQRPWIIFAYTHNDLTELTNGRINLLVNLEKCRAQQVI